MHGRIECDEWRANPYYSSLVSHYLPRFTFHFEHVRIPNMIVGVCTIQLHLPANGSLKGKRAALKPLLIRLHKEFNVSSAEIDQQDSWQESTIAIACVSNDPTQAEQVLNQAVSWIELNRPDVQLVDWQIELL
jgi:uncharacterized protein